MSPARRRQASRVARISALLAAPLTVGLLLAGWLAVQQGEAATRRENRSRSDSFARGSGRSDVTRWFSLSRRQGDRGLEIRLDEILRDLDSDGSLRVDRAAIDHALREVMGQDVDVDTIRLGELLDQVRRVRVRYETLSVDLGRNAMRLLMRPMAAERLALEDMRLADLLGDGLQVDLDAVPEGLDIGGFEQMLNLVLARVGRSDTVDSSGLEEQRAAENEYADVVRTVEQLRREGLAGDADALYREAFRRLVETGRSDAVPLLDGHQRLERELSSADLGSMSQAERIAFRWEARRRAFDPETAEMLFGRREAIERYEIDRVNIESDPGLTETDVAERIRERRLMLKVELAGQGSYVGFVGEDRKAVEADLRTRLGDRMDRITAAERDAAVRQAYLNRLPGHLREHVESVRRRQP